MKKLTIITSALAVMLIFQSCATTQSLPDDVRTKIYNAGYDQTFKATVQTLSDAGYIIKNMNSKIGLINTDYTRNSVWSAFLKGNRRTKVNALIKPLNNKTRVRLTISAQEMSLFSWKAAPMSKSNAKEYYQRLFTEIGKRIGK